MNLNHVTSTHAPNLGGYVVGDLVIEPRLRRIRCPDGEVELTQRVFDLLQLFASEPFTLHARETIFERIWGTLHVEDTNLTQNISVLRKALGEERKHWIKTVSRTGYSFEPPYEVRCVEDTRDLAPASAIEPEPAPSPVVHGSEDAIGATKRATDASQASAGQAALPAATPRTPATRWSTMASPLLFVLITFFALTTPGSRAVPTTTTALAGLGHSPNMSIVVTQASAGATDAERQASNLLREWVRWKLARLPSIDLVEEENLIAGRTTPSYFLDLSVSASQAHPDRFVFDIAFRPVYRTDARAAENGDQGGMKRRIPLHGANGRLPEMIDAASNQALAIILPDMLQQRWPKLDLDSGAAMRFAEAAAASRRRDANALQLLQGVVQAAPKFGPARMLLARELADHKQFRQAAEQAALGRALSLPLPTDAAILLEAEAAALTPTQSKNALQLYSHLWTANPTRLDFLLAQARILQRMSRPEAAFQLLSQPEWDRQTGPLRIRQLVARADSAFMLGYLDQSEQNADDAIERIEYAPEGLASELGAAQLIRARTGVQRHRFDNQTKPFSEAAATFEAAGYHHDAEVTHFYEAMYSYDVPLAEKRLAALLKSTREHGDHLNAIWAQRMMAMLFRWAGDREKSMRMFNAGLESASLAGDIPSSQLLELDLLGENLNSGDIRQAEQRVERLRGNQLWTKYRYRASRFESDLLIQQGRYREALAVLDRTLGDAGRAKRWDMPRGEAGLIACARMYALIDVGELETARAQSRGCRDSYPSEASLGEARIDLLAGNTDAARRHLQAAEEGLDKTPGDWDDIAMRTKLATLKIRLRDYTDADRLLLSLYKMPAHMNYGALVAEIEVGLAETAAARGDWNTVAEYSAKVRKRLPHDARHFIDRLETLEISRLRAAGYDRDAQTITAALDARARQHGGALVAMESDARRH